MVPSCDAEEQYALVGAFRVSSDRVFACLTTATMCSWASGFGVERFGCGCARLITYAERQATQSEFPCLELNVRLRLTRKMRITLQCNMNRQSYVRLLTADFVRYIA